MESLLAAIALPDGNDLGQLEPELNLWREQLQIKLFNPLPYPIICGSADNLAWTIEAKSDGSDSADLATVASKKKRKAKKRKQSVGRICVKLKGLKDFIFKVQCDRRQLPIFRQFLADYQAHYSTPEQERFSQALFVFQFAQLLWREDTQNHRPKKKKAENSQAPEISKPWNTHRLYLHCTIDTRLLSMEGTEEVKQEEKQKIVKELKGREILRSTEIEELDLTEGQKGHIKRRSSTLSRLENPYPDRPSIPLYQGNSLITVGVSLSRQTPLIACVIDIKTGHVLESQTAKQLLIVQGVKVKKGKRSLFQLRREQSRLINKLHHRRQHNLLKQTIEQRQNDYREDKTESNLGLYVERLIASRLVRLAVRWKASSIVVPDLKHIREVIESDIQAKAKRKFPQQKELQNQYAKQLRTSFHRWSYNRLTQCIRERADRAGILVITGQQPSQGSLQQKARDVAMSAHRL